MTSLLSLDPGLTSFGQARWLVGPKTLQSCGATSVRKGTAAWACALDHAGQMRKAYTVALEEMRHRSHDSKSVPNDLIKLHGVGCMVATMVSIGDVHFYTAAQWKKSVPKRIHHPRILEALQPLELHIVQNALAKTKKSNHKEVLDAVGLGLFHLGRIDNAGRSLY